MELIRINTLEQLFEVENEWAQILASNKNTNPFIEFEWVALWMKHLGIDKHVEIIAVKSGKSYIGFFPFVRKKSWFAIKYEMLGLGQTNYMDFIVLRDKLEETVPFVFEKLISEKRQIVFNLHGILESSPSYSVLFDLITTKGYGHTLHKVVTPYINLEKIQMNEYMEKRKKLHRLERREKRLRLLGNVEHKVCSYDEMDLIYRIHDNRWEKKSDTSGFTNIAEKEFYKELFHVDSDRLKTLVDALYVEGRMIAFDYGFICGSRFVGYVLGYDDAFESFSPGRMLEKESIIDCVTKREIDIFDLSIGYEPYKLEWNTHIDYTTKFIFSSKGFLATSGRLVNSLKEKLKDQLKKNRKVVHFKRETLGYMKYLARKLFRNRDRLDRKRIQEQLRRQISSYLWKKEHSLIMKKEVERTKKAGLGEGYAELELKDAINDKRFMEQDLKKVCTKLYGGYQAYYRLGSSDGELIWTNRKVLRLKSISYIKELRKNAIWLEGWSSRNLVDVCRFVNKEHLIHTILLEVDAQDRSGIRMLEEAGFQHERSVYERTRFGRKKLRVTEKSEN